MLPRITPSHYCAAVLLLLLACVGPVLLCTALATSEAKISSGKGPRTLPLAAAPHQHQQQQQHTDSTQAASPAAEPVGASANRAIRCQHSIMVGYPGGGDQCGKIREKQDCTPDGCLWCANKYSPWPGSDGVCVSEDQAKYLPDATYKCKKVSAAGQQQTDTTTAIAAA